MKDQYIITIGKTVFGLSFLLGNICLFGYMLTKDEGFAIGGVFLLILGSVINLLVILLMLIYAVFKPSVSDACLRAIGILMINIPLATIYAFIGINLN